MRSSAKNNKSSVDVLPAAKVKRRITEPMRSENEPETDPSLAASHNFNFIKPGGSTYTLNKFDNKHDSQPLADHATLATSPSVDHLLKNHVSSTAHTIVGASSIFNHGVGGAVPASIGD